MLTKLLKLVYHWYACVLRRHFNCYFLILVLLQTMQLVGNSSFQRSTVKAAKRGELGQFALGLTLLGDPYSPMSLLNVFTIDSYPWIYSFNLFSYSQVAYTHSSITGLLTSSFFIPNNNIF